MDPDRCLEVIRELLDKYREGWDTWEEDDADELAEHVEALDEWIQGGGFLPAAWRPRPPDAAPKRRRR